MRLMGKADLVPEAEAFGTRQRIGAEAHGNPEIPERLQRRSAHVEIRVGPGAMRNGDPRLGQNLEIGLCEVDGVDHKALRI
jgi:hypothetical protein